MKQVKIPNHFVTKYKLLAIIALGDGFRQFARD